MVTEPVTDGEAFGVPVRLQGGPTSEGSGAHAAMLPLRCPRSAARLAPARAPVQPLARKHVELTDFGTLRSRPTNKELTHESWRNQADGHLDRTHWTPDATAVCTHSKPVAEGSDGPRRDA